MTITTTTLGVNTSQITLDGELNSAAFIEAIDAAIVAGGWIQHDISNPLYRVYKAVNLDGISYKFASVAFDVYRQRFWLSSWESWDNVAHTGVNEVYTVNGGYWQPYSFNNCDVIVFANERWLGFQTYIRNVAAHHPVFVQETTRDHVQDTAAGGVPCWGWLTPAGTSCVAPWGSGGLNTYLFATPRNKAGNTGKLAAQRSFLATSVARICNSSFVANGVVASGAVNFGNGLAGAANNASADVWDASAVYAQTLRVGHGYSEVQGRMAGLKATKVPNAGLMNRVAVPIDSKALFDAAGISTEHWVIPINSEIPTTATPGSVNIGFGSGIVYDACWNGTAIFMSRTGGFQRYNLNTGTLGPIIPATTGNAPNMGFVFDGLNIYFTAGDRIGKWDTSTDTVTYSAAVAGATMVRMCFNGTHFWALDKTATSTNMVIRKFDQSLSLLASVSVAMGAPSYVGFDIACDIFGNMIMTAGAAGTVNTAKVFKVNSSTGALIGSSSSASNGQSSGGNLSWMGAKALFDVYFTVSVNISYGTIDATAATPAWLAVLAAAGTASVQAGIFGYYNGFSRYGRTHASATAASVIAMTDYEYFGGSDYVTTSATSGSGYPVVHFGTHVLALSATQAILTPYSGMMSTVAGGQLLLPK